uniref:Hemojuvelin BMP co-receptor n=2 Tax=Eptatretus burgeri TaxID=7764 RepID=A0A8C4QPZ1_EPTBU
MGSGALVPPPPRLIVLPLLLLALRSTANAQCHIRRCTAEFVDTTSGVLATEGRAHMCAALRSYEQCAQRFTRACRGDITYHSIVRGIPDLMEQHQCSHDGPTISVTRKVGSSCSLSSAEGRRLFCSVFGDPHVRTFREELHTCRARGAWPLLDTAPLFVQATNSPAGARGATVMTKITIIFHGFRDCTEQKVYQAEVGNLPAAFVDGSRNGGPRDTAGVLRVLERDPGRHVEIHANFADTLVSVRHVGGSLSFAVRMPEALLMPRREQKEGGGGEPQRELEPAPQLCLDGCPRRERLQLSRVTENASGALSVMSVKEAQTRCHEMLPEEDFYFKACVFDLMVTGQMNFSHTAAEALQDARALLPDSASAHVAKNGPSSASRQSASVCLLVVLLVLS